MKKIVLYGPARDNAGGYCDAGTELEIGDKAAQITLDRARELIERGGAVSATAAAEVEREAAAGEAEDAAAPSPQPSPRSGRGSKG